MQQNAINLLDNPFALLSQEESEWGYAYKGYEDLYDDGYFRHHRINLIEELPEGRLHPNSGDLGEKWAG